MIEETRRQQKERINKLLLTIPIKTEEERNKIYSWRAVVDNNELKKGPTKEDRGFTAKFCKECDSFTCHIGVKCTICKSKKTGLGNPEIHSKTIKSQIERGTFNMLNSEVQKK